MGTIKLYVYGGIAILLIGLGVYVRGVFAQRAALRVEVVALKETISQFQAGITSRDGVILQLKSSIAQTNATLDKMEKDAAALVKARNDAQARIEKIQDDYAALQAQHQAPLTGDCDAQVREFARRAGAKP